MFDDRALRGAICRTEVAVQVVVLLVLLHFEIIIFFSNQVLKDLL
jgi:hypothetical protein